jgi:transposase
MVIETSQPIAKVARELGIVEGTLGNWVNTYRREHTAEETPLTLNERARLRELERETRELKMENDQPGLLPGLHASTGLDLTSSSPHHYDL